MSNLYYLRTDSQSGFGVSIYADSDKEAVKKVETLFPHIKVVQARLTVKGEIHVPAQVSGPKVGETVKYRWQDGSEHVGVIKQSGSKWIQITNSKSGKTDYILPQNVGSYIQKDSPTQPVKVVIKSSEETSLNPAPPLFEAPYISLVTLSKSLYSLVSTMKDKSFRKAAVGSNFFILSRTYKVARVLQSELREMFRLGMIRIHDEGPVDYSVEPTIADMLAGLPTPQPDIMGITKFEIDPKWIETHQV